MASTCFWATGCLIDSDILRTSREESPRSREGDLTDYECSSSKVPESPTTSLRTPALVHCDDLHGARPGDCCLRRIRMDCTGNSGQPDSTSGRAHVAGD